MARLFDDAASEHLLLGSSPLAGLPCTFACRIFTDDVTVRQNTISLVGAAMQPLLLLRIRGDSGGDPIDFTYRGDAGGAITATTANGVSVNTWHTIVATIDSSANQEVWLDADAGNKGTGSGASSAGVTWTSTMIGRDARDTGSDDMSGRIAEAAIWNTVLSDADIAGLHANVSPLFFKPANLVAYWPLGGIYNDGNSGNVANADYDIVGGNNMNPVNTPSTAPHPPGLIYPTDAQMSLVVAAAAPAGGIARLMFLTGDL